MALNDVKFKLGQGGLGRPLPGEDHISAMLVYTSSLPSGFSASSRIKKIFSVQEAENLGISGTYADETKAVATYTVTNGGTVGETIELKVLEPKGYVTIATAFAQVGGIATTAQALTDSCNASTPKHGYTASVSSGLITINARPGMGIFLNTGTPLVAVLTGVGGNSATHTGIIAQFGSGALADGVASKQATWHYHIAEFFRIQPNGVLYIGMYASNTNLQELVTMQQFANGTIRQAMILLDSVVFSSASSYYTYAQVVCDQLFENHMPLSSVLLAFDYTGISNVSDITLAPSLATYSAKNVSVVISQDGDALGFDLFKSTGKSITNIGALLGCVSFAKVNEDIAWIGKFNISDGTENNVPAIANGTLVSTLSKALIDSLDTARYIFTIKKVGYEGSWFNDSHTCITQSSDYAYIENNRTIDKSIRLLYARYLPDLNSPLVVNKDGTLKDTTIAYFETSGNEALTQMERDEEISEKKVTVDSTQNVLTNSELVIAVYLLPVGVARNIVVKIGYKLSI